MALTMYMKVTGKNQGEIKGSCDQGGDKKDKILVYAMDHKVEIPKDTHTGLPTGQRIHHPLTVTKAKDVASPKLFAACCAARVSRWMLNLISTESNQPVKRNCTTRSPSMMR